MSIIDVNYKLRSIVEDRSIPSGLSTCSYLASLTMTTTTSIYIPSNKCNHQSLTSFDLSAFKLINSIDIYDNNFGNTKTFILDGLIKLQHLTIRINSFTQAKYDWGYDTSKSFHVLNCVNLESISIGEYCFSDYSGEFELSNLPELQSITIGTGSSWCRNFYCSSFDIRGIE